MEFVSLARRLTTTAGVVAGASALVFGTAAPALASTNAVNPPTVPVVGQGVSALPIGSAGNPDHVMGSAIRAHEGTVSSPNSRPNSLPKFTPNSGQNGSQSSGQTPGLDVSHYQGTINWASVKSKGAKFAYMKATEGTSFRDSQFNNNYTGSYNQGIIRGAYHFARPDVSAGAAQADYFVAHGGGWSSDGKTLPGLLDIEWGSSDEGGDCYGYSQSDMSNWIASFVNEYHAKTTRWPVIYTATSWWSECTGTSASFGNNDPLMIARYSSSVGSLPHGWSVYTIWQFADSGTFPGDQDRFNGDITRV
ncbi:MAG: lysozyme, partial [Sciscionella sp.]|nr:lysozyme [Sciscionella sp.]